MSVLAFSGLKNRDISLETYSVLRTLKPKSALYYRSGSPTLRNGFGRLGAVSEQGSNSSAPVGSHTPTTCRAFQYMQHNLRPRHSQKHCKTSAGGKTDSIGAGGTTATSYQLYVIEEPASNQTSKRFRTGPTKTSQSLCLDAASASYRKAQHESCV